VDDGMLISLGVTCDQHGRAVGLVIHIALWPWWPVTEPGVWGWGGVHENPDLPEAFHERRMQIWTNYDTHIFK